MERTFKLSVPSETRTIYTDRAGRADVTYTVTNAKSFPTRGAAHVMTKDSTRSDWMSVAGESERGFGGGESQQFKVAVAIPRGTPAGIYGFRLVVANVANPQEDFAEGDTVAVDYKPAEEVKPKRPWWLWAAVAAGVLVIAVTLVLILRPKGVPVPNVVGKDAQDAATALTAAGLKVGNVTKQRSGSAEVGSVLSETPPAAEKINAGASVDLVVQDVAPVIVPSVVGSKSDAATTLLEKASLKVTVTTARQGNAAPGTVLSQDPAANASVAPESTVTLTVQANPQPVAMILVTSRPVADAQARLSALNIAFKLQPVAADPTRLGTITTQSIPEDAPVAPGAVVTLGVGANVVPNVVGNPLATAVIALQQKGFQVGTVNGLAQLPVISQSVAANSPQMPGTKIDLQLQSPFIGKLPVPRTMLNPLIKQPAQHW